MNDVLTKRVQNAHQAHLSNAQILDSGRDPHKEEEGTGPSEICASGMLLVLVDRMAQARRASTRESKASA